MSNGSDASDFPNKKARVRFTPKFVGDAALSPEERLARHREYHRVTANNLAHALRFSKLYEGDVYNGSQPVATNAYLLKVFQGAVSRTLENSECETKDQFRAREIVERQSYFEPNEYEEHERRHELAKYLSRVLAYFAESKTSQLRFFEERFQDWQKLVESDLEIPTEFEDIMNQELMKFDLYKKHIENDPKVDQEYLCAQWLTSAGNDALATHAMEIWQQLEDMRIATLAKYGLVDEHPLDTTEIVREHDPDARKVPLLAPRKDVYGDWDETSHML